MDSQSPTSLIVFLKRWIVPLCGGSLFVSVLVESYVTLPSIIPYLFGGLSLISLIASIKYSPRLCITLGIIFLFVSLGVYRFHQEKEYRKERILSVGSEMVFGGSMNVVSPPDFRENSTKVIATHDETRFLVTLPKDTDVDYGDTLDVQGKITIPESFETDQGRLFNYSGYLAKDRVFYEIRYPSFQIIKDVHGSRFLKYLYRARSFIRSSIYNSHRVNTEGLLSGILLGERGGVADHQDAFIQTGTIHIVALSGYNVAIISEAITYILTPLFGIVSAMMLGACGVVLFAIMTGLGATIVRATIMGLLAFLARVTGKQYQVGRALVVAGMGMIIINPWILVYDVSFQLSFIATLGLIYCTPVVSLWFTWISTRSLRDVVSATVATNISVLPFVAYKMGIVSLVSIPANILIAPLVPLSMLFGTLSIAIYSVIPILSIPFVKISSFLLSSIIFIAEKGSNAPLSFVVVPSFSVKVVIVIYLLLIMYIAHFSNSEE